MGRAATALAILLGLTLAAPAHAQLAVDTSPQGPITLVGADGARTPIGNGRVLRDPAWSPDGTRLAATAYDRKEQASLVVLDAAGGAPRRIAGSEGLAQADWSPDGATLVATRSRRANGTYLSEIVVLPAAGGTPRTLTTGRYDSDPAWSPDGGEIAFARTDPEAASAGTSLGGIVAMRPDGSGLRTITSHGSEPAWSPDGTTIVFTSGRDRNGEQCGSDECTPNGELYLVPSGGGAERRLTVTKDAETQPDWSPDGTRIAFASTKGAAEQFSDEVFAMDPDGGCVTQLTWASGDALAPAWRPGSGPATRGPCGGRLVRFTVTADVARVRAPYTEPLYAGTMFAGRGLDYARDDLIVYSDCVTPGCRSIQLQTVNVCTRNPAALDVRAKSVQVMRGALVVGYPGGFEIFSGGTNTVVFGLRRRELRAFVAALRPVRGPTHLRGRLAPPQFPAKVFEELRRSDPRVPRALRRFGRAAHRTPPCARQRG